MPLGRDPKSGKYKQHWEAVKGRKVDAERRLVELQAELYRGTFIKPEKITVGEYLTDWLENTARLQISPTTYKGYKSIIGRHLIPGMGNIYLSNLTGTAIQRYYAQKLKDSRLDGRPGTLTTRSVRSHYRVLHRALKSAITRGLLSHNAAENTEPPIPIAKEMRPMTGDQLNIFLKKLKGSPYYELFYTSLFTALRRSEVLALRWQDIDLENGQLAINRVLHHIDGEFIFREPKTEKSRATIALTPSTTALLEDYKQRKAGECILMGMELKESDLAFCHFDGEPISPNTISQYWRRFVNRIGMHGIRLHDARHTHATLMLIRGVNIKVIQERLRHANIETTLGIYSHVLPGMQEEAAKIFDEYAPK